MKVSPDGRKSTLCKYSELVQYSLNELEEARNRYLKEPSPTVKGSLIEKNVSTQRSAIKRVND